MRLPRVRSRVLVLALSRGTTQLVRPPGVRLGILVPRLVPRGDSVGETSKSEAGDSRSYPVSRGDSVGETPKSEAGDSQSHPIPKGDGQANLPGIPMPSSQRALAQKVQHPLFVPIMAPLTSGYRVDEEESDEDLRMAFFLPQTHTPHWRSGHSLPSKNHSH